MRRRAYLSAVAGVSVAGCSAVGGAGWGSDGGQRRADLSIVRRFFDSGKKPAVHVRVTNNSDVPANTIEAKADWLDEQGNFIGTSREDLTELPGQWTWQPGISPLAPIDYAHDVELRLDYADGEANPSEEIELQLENTKDGARRSSTTVVVENTGDEEESLRAGAQFFEEDELILAEKHQLNILPPGITWRFDVSIQTVREVSARAVATRPY